MENKFQKNFTLFNFYWQALYSLLNFNGFGYNGNNLRGIVVDHFQMEETPANKKKSLSPDWYVKGALARLGDTLDKYTGRKREASSTLATSELIERLKRLIDAEARETETGKKIVPHNIKLKIQWDRFSTDSDSVLETLKNQLLIALVDHINDRRYYTNSELLLEVKPDYFIEGVKFSASFSDTAEDNEAELNVTVPELHIENADQLEIKELPSFGVKIKFEINGKEFVHERILVGGERLSLGRTKESDISVEEDSVSKMHASFLINEDGKTMVADTGSTNGTFINGERIAYGKAILLEEGAKLKLGTVEVDILSERITPEPQDAADDMVETSTHEEMTQVKPKDGLAATVPAIAIPEMTIIKPLVPKDSKDD